MRKTRGFTLIEIMIATGIATALLLAGYAMVNMAADVYKRISGHEDAALQLKRASRRIQTDLLASRYTDPSTGSTDLYTETVPGFGTGFLGDAICFLTLNTSPDAKGPADVDRETGAPFWQRNIIYYTTIPTADPCTGGPDADGYEDRCPHKILIRKVVDNIPATGPWVPPPAVPSVEETILPTMAGLLGRPATLNLSAMETGQVEDAELIATNLLKMRVEVDPAGVQGEVLVTLQAFNEPSAQRVTNVGSTPLSNHAKTLTHVISVFPRNNNR